MRWKIVNLLFLLLVLVLAAGIAVDAQEDPPTPNHDLAESSPGAGIGGVQHRSGKQNVVWPEAAELALNDDCQNAIPISLTLENDYAARLDTTQAAISTTDPLQSCSWGGPAVNSASVWWRVSVSEDGQITFSSISENPQRYDTVVSIYPAAAGCSSLSPAVEIGCDDDTHAFQSKGSALVDAGENYLVEISGWGAANSGGELDVFGYFEQDTWWQTAIGNTPPSALSRQVTVSDEQYLYLLGGQNPAGSQEVYRYDPATQIWSFLANMPVSYSNTDGAYIDGRIYIPTGFAGSSPYAGVHYTYVISDDTWTTSAPITSSGAIDEPIAWGAAVADPDGNAYYYTGGRHGSDPDTPLNYIFKYLVVTDEWRTRTSMNTARFGHQAAFIDGKLCVAGGIGAGELVLDSVECFNWTGNNTWVSIASLNIPRALFGSAVGPDGRWYVFGGLVGTESTTPKTEVYDPQSGQWTLLNQQWSLHQSRDWVGGARVGHQLLAAGGFLPDTELVVNTFEWLNIPATGTKLLFVPLVVNGDGQMQSNDYEPNDAIPLAYGPLQNDVPLSSGFPYSWDTEDFFYFQLDITKTVQIQLEGIPAESDYHLYLYGLGSDGNAKHLFGSSENASNADESLQVENLPPGPYQIRVRNFMRRPSAEQYTLRFSH